MSRLSLNNVWKDFASEVIDRDFMDEKKASLREFEVKKVELKDNLLQEFEDRRKQIEDERFNVGIFIESPEAKPASTRKLRRRPNEPTPLEPKRRKMTQSHITFLLDDKEVDDDLIGLFKGKITASMQRGEQSGKQILLNPTAYLRCTHK
jgi:Sin3 histone deacetylase corepressor complex component SDS3